VGAPLERAPGRPRRNPERVFKGRLKMSASSRVRRSAFRPTSSSAGSTGSRHPRAGRQPLPCRPRVGSNGWTARWLRGARRRAGIGDDRLGWPTRPRTDRLNSGDPGTASSQPLRTSGAPEGTAHIYARRGGGMKGRYAEKARKRAFSRASSGLAGTVTPWPSSLRR
jgi:hypothetical protein